MQPSQIQRFRSYARHPALPLVLLCLLICFFTFGCTLRYGDVLPDGTPADQVSWLDETEYPFSSLFLETPAGQLHYIDEGPRDGAPILFVHGTPTWSFLYRNVIKELAATHRMVAPDHIGFGLSSKPPLDAFGYTPQDHSANLVRLLDTLDLTNVTLVVHDLGGPIGIGAALARPDRIARIVVINSFAWSLADNPDVQDIDRLLTSSFGRWLYLKRNFSPEFLLLGAFSDGFNLKSATLRHYTHPFADETTRFGLLQIGRSLLGSSPWFEELWAERESLAPKVKLLIFGLEDEFFGADAFAKWKENFPAAESIGLEGVGHFPQEEKPSVIAEALAQLHQSIPNQSVVTHD